MGGSWGQRLREGHQPSWGYLALPCRGRRVSQPRGLGLGVSRRAALLRPKRPTGLIPRPLYQAGSMSGAAEGRAVPSPGRVLGPGRQVSAQGLSSPTGPLSGWLPGHQAMLEPTEARAPRGQGHFWTGGL